MTFTHLLRILSYQEWIRFGIGDRIIRAFDNFNFWLKDSFKVYFFDNIYTKNPFIFINFSAYSFGAHAGKELSLMRNALDGVIDPVVIDTETNRENHSFFDPTLANKVPIKILLEGSVSDPLRTIIVSDSNQFELVNDPEQAEIILFENDKPSYIRQTPEYKRYSEKCVVVNEFDEPTYFLPACYASNKRSWLSYKRVRTIPYFLSQYATPNPFIKDFTSTNSRRYLYSFRGGSTSWVRKRLFKTKFNSDDIYIEDSNHYHHWNHDETYADQREALQRQYAELLDQSSFVLCPRGAGVSSIRLFEVMQAGRVPVIIADDWIPVDGIPWSEFSIQIAEKDLSALDRIIRSYENEAKQLGMKARQAWMNFCSPEIHAKFLAQTLVRIQHERNEDKERFIRSLFPFLEMKNNAKKNVKILLKYSILRTFALMGLEFPYSLNRPTAEQLQKLKS